MERTSDRLSHLMHLVRQSQVTTAFLQTQAAQEKLRLLREDPTVTPEELEEQSRSTSLWIEYYRGLAKEAGLNNYI